MASTRGQRGSSGIFWMNSVSDEEQPLVFVPGMDGGVKSKPSLKLGPDSTSTSIKRGSKMRTKPASSCKSYTAQRRAGKIQGHFQSDDFGVCTKEKVLVHQSPAVLQQQTFSQPVETFRPSSELPVILETSRNRSQVSLKDLCLEDKKRIANLIEELARVREEKEESVQRLKDEQGNFERHIQQLEQQNLVIEHEWKSLHQQYRECQELLGLYQQYLSQQQAKLHQSIGQLSQPPAHNKVLSGEEAPSRTAASRANGSLFDGSYLSHAANGAPQTQVYSSCVARDGAVQTLPNPTFDSCDSDFSLTGGPIGQRAGQRRECGMPHRHYRCQCCLVNHHDAGSGRDSGSHPVNSHHDTCSLKDCERYSSALHSGVGVASETKEALTRPLLGHEDWEKQRHKLLLQKMQLEKKRERLQARLAEQEERLNRHTKQLQESGVGDRRIEQPTEAELSSLNAGNGPGSVSPSHQDLPSSVCKDAEALPEGHHPQTEPAASASAELLERTRKDTTTAPAKSPAGPRETTSVSEIPKTPEERLDFSVVELLDILSPISTTEQQKPSAPRPKTPRHRSTLASLSSVGRIPLNPGGPHPQSTQQDLEESQLLEDIFFVC